MKLYNIKDKDFKIFREKGEIIYKVRKIVVILDFLVFNNGC